MKPFLVRSFMYPHETKTVNKYVDLMINNKKVGLYKNDSGNYWQLNGDPLTDAIGLVYQETVSAKVQKDLSLSYTMLRRWEQGCYVPWHRNRWECEYTVAIQISDNHWSLGFTDNDSDNPLINGVQKESTIFTPTEGDAVIWQGAETYQGRRKLKDSACTTLMLYFVEKESHLDYKDNRTVYGDNYKTYQRPHGEWKIET